MVLCNRALSIASKQYCAENSIKAVFSIQNPSVVFPKPYSRRYHFRRHVVLLLYTHRTFLKSLYLIARFAREHGFRDISADLVDGLTAVSQSAWEEGALRKTIQQAKVDSNYDKKAFGFVRARS